MAMLGISLLLGLRRSSLMRPYSLPPGGLVERDYMSISHYYLSGSSRRRGYEFSLTPGHHEIRHI